MTRLCQSQARWTNFRLEACDPQRQGPHGLHFGKGGTETPGLQKQHRSSLCPVMGGVGREFPREAQG